MGTKHNSLSDVNRGVEACKHPSVTVKAEYQSGSPSGNFICTRCNTIIPVSLERAKAVNRFWATTRHDLIF